MALGRVRTREKRLAPGGWRCSPRRLAFCSEDHRIAPNALVSPGPVTGGRAVRLVTRLAAAPGAAPLELRAGARCGRLRDPAARRSGRGGQLARRGRPADDGRGREERQDRGRRQGAAEMEALDVVAALAP
jgi:hypothetical protein